MLPHLHNGWQVDQAILSEEDRVVVIRFGHDWDPTCMKMDEVLYSIAEKVGRPLVRAAFRSFCSARRLETVGESCPPCAFSAPNVCRAAAAPGLLAEGRRRPVRGRTPAGALPVCSLELNTVASVLFWEDFPYFFTI